MPLLLSMASCALTKFAGHYSSVDSNTGRYSGNIYTTDRNSYRISELPDGWKKVKVKGGDLAFHNSSSESSITVDSVCKEAKTNYSLKALSKSLVTGIEDKKIVKSENLKVDKSEGLYTEYVAKLDGELFGLATVVYKSEKCNYDFTYSATENHFSSNLNTFRNLIAGFEEISAK